MIVLNLSTFLILLALGSLPYVLCVAVAWRKWKKRRPTR